MAKFDEWWRRTFADHGIGHLGSEPWHERNATAVAAGGIGDTSEASDMGKSVDGKCHFAAPCELDCGLAQLRVHSHHGVVEEVGCFGNSGGAQRFAATERETTIGCESPVEQKILGVNQHAVLR